MVNLLATQIAFRAYPMLPPIDVVLDKNIDTSMDSKLHGYWFRSIFLIIENFRKSLQECMADREHHLEDVIFKIK